jgi:hypothetical protein
MTHPQSSARRLLLAAGLAAVLGSAALTGAPAGAQPAPPIVKLDVIEVRGHSATVFVTGTAPISITHTIQPLNGTDVGVEVPIRRGRAPFAGDATLPSGGVAGLPGRGTASTGGAQAAAVYQTQHRLDLTGLQSNMNYELVVTATAEKPNDKQPAVVRQRFTTLRERLRITVEEINIEDDGDGWLSGDGDPRWEVDLKYPNSNAAMLCFPNPGDCSKYGNYGEGRITPRYAGQPLYWLLAEEISPLPDELTITVRAYEDDPEVTGACVGDCEETRPASITWRRPQGVESHTARVQVRGDNGEGFKSVLTFKFEVFHDATDMSKF